MFRTARHAWHGVVDGLNSLRSEWVEYERPIMVEPLEPRVLMAGQGWDVVLIDRTLPHSQLLMRAVLAGARVMTYDGRHDSADAVIERVVSLADSSGWQIGSLSILAHGRPGQFMLGNQWVSSQSIADDASAWEKLGAVLAPHGTIRLYGCNVADGFAGPAVLDRLATITGAEVFASSDITGRGGDWTLESSSAGAAADLPSANAGPFNTRILVRYPDQLAGALSASIDTATGSLSAAGTTDWVHWTSPGLPSDRKAGGNLIGNYTLVGSGSATSYTDDPRALSWSDGAPDGAFAETPGSGSGVYVSGIGNGFSITVPADTTVRALTVYAGGWNSAATFTAHLSDASAADFTDTTAAATGQYDRSYTIYYSANSPGQTLTVTWTMASGAGNVALSAVALGLAPTVASPAAASPSTVTGTTAALSVLGADDGGETNLTYAWSVVAKPGGAADPTYSANGTHAASNSTATFYDAGNYTLQVTVTDAGGLSTRSTVDLVVQQTFSQIAVTNLLPALADNTSHTFAATAEDQFGDPMLTQPTFSWSVDGGGVGGTIDPASALYTAPAGGTGTDTVRASSGGISGTAIVNVTSDGIFTGGTDIGYPGQAGTFDFDPSSGTYTLQGGGYDIWNNWDAFYYASRTISGDVTIVARVTSVGWSDWWSKAGVMIRATSAGDSPFVMVTVNPDNAVEIQWRTTSGGYADWTGNRVDDNGPVKWVKLVRTGDTFGGYYSTDGANWTLLGTISVSMPAASAAGLMVTAHNDLTLNPATFDNVSITDPVRVAAPATSAANNFTQSSTGLSVLGAADAGESTLVYDWSVLAKPTGASDPTFSTNGTNAAKNTLATFYASGDYTFHVLITDGVHSSGSDVDVTVAAIYTGMVLTPAAATIVPTANVFQFTLTMYDQFGAAVAVLPPLSWSATGANNSISSTGLFTAGTTPGVFDINVNGYGYTQSATVTVQPALNGWWKFDENGGSTASDSSGGNNTGTLVNGPTWTAGQFGSALSFDPTLSQYVQVPDSAGLDPTDGVTASAWIDAADWNGNRRILQKGYSDNQYRLLAEGGLLKFDVAGVGDVTAPLPGIGAWHQVVGTYNGSILALYVDGVLVASAAAQGAMATTTDPLVIGAKNVDAFDDTDCFSGSIDDVRVYGRGMSQAEVAALYANAGVPPTVVSAAAASPSIVSGDTSAVSVLGDSPAGEGTLIYSWAATALPPGALQPTFTPNSTNGAKNAAVTFFDAGTYTLTCTIVDANGNFVLSSVNVTVQQILSGIAINHSNWTIPAGIVYPLQAVTVDQFGNPMTIQSGVTWTVQPGGTGGTVDSAGLYTSPSAGGTDVITAFWAGYSATTTLTSVGTANINYSAGVVPGGLALNGGPTVAGGALVITDDNWGEARSAFQTLPVDVRAFTTSFGFQITDPGADGFTFSLQSGSPTALGGSGGALGYAGITHSIAVKFDLWNNAGEGSNSTGLYVDGALPTLSAIDLTPAGIDLHSGHVFNVVMTYDGATLLVQITDALTGASATQSYSIDIPAALGSDVGYAGFTGATGGLYATQRVLHWEYVNRTNADLPVVAVGPAATMDPTQTTASLSVLGSELAGESGLTYTWSVVGTPAGAADPVLGENADNASKNTSVQFFAAGDYSFLVAISDGTLTTLAAVDVTVQQVLSGIQIAQVPQVILAGTSYSFTVVGLDQFGQQTAAPPVVAWSVDPGPAAGTIDANGLFTAPAAGEGVATLRATSGAVAASTQVLVSTLGMFTASADIGSPDVAGSMRYDSTTATYTVSGGGWDIWNNSDQFHFVSVPVTGDAALIARVTQVAHTDDWAKAGVMLRASADADSMFVDMLVTPTNVSFQWRDATGGPADAYTVWGPTSPMWVKLVRNGNTFTGWYSQDGVSWSQCGPAVAVPMPSQTLAGLAVTAHNGALLNTSKFQNVTLALAPTISGATASTVLITGTQTGLRVLGADALGEAGLIYSWATVSKPIGAPDPVFESNGTHAATSTAVTLLHAGVYVFEATVTNAYGLTASSLLSVRAVQTATRVELSPPVAAVEAGGAEQFAALAVDQFGNPLVTQPRFSWWVDGGGLGSVNGNGLFVAPGTTGSAIVRASADGLVGDSRITVYIVNAPPPAPGTGDAGGRASRPAEVTLVGLAPSTVSIDRETEPSVVAEVVDTESPLRAAVLAQSGADTAVHGVLSQDTIQASLMQALARGLFGPQRGQDGLASALRLDLTQYARLRPEAAALSLGSEAMLDAARAQFASELSVYSALAGSAVFRHAIDAVLQQAEARGITASMVSKVAATTTVAFSAGYLLWCLQGGTLFMSMLTAVPFWTWFDPLPVLDSWDQLRSGLSARGGTGKSTGRDDDADMSWLTGELPAS